MESRACAPARVVGARRRRCAREARAARDADPGDSRYSLPLPGYESSFRRAVGPRPAGSPLTGDAAADAAALMRAIRGGQSVHRGRRLGDRRPRSSSRRPTRRHGARRRRARDRRSGDAARAQQRAGRVHDDRLAGQRAGRGRERSASFTVEAPDGAGGLPGRDPRPDRPTAPPWIISNPIYVRAPARRGTGRAPSLRPRRSLPLFDGRTTAGWTSENDPTSLRAIDAVPDGRRQRAAAALRALGRVRGRAVLAARRSKPPTASRDYDRVAFTIRAEHPMRISVQLRARGAGRARRNAGSDRSTSTRPTASARSSSTT